MGLWKLVLYLLFSNQSHFKLRVLQPISELPLFYVSKLLSVRKHLSANELCVSHIWDGLLLNSLCKRVWQFSSQSEAGIAKSLQVIIWFIEGSLFRIVLLLVTETTKVPFGSSLQITGNQFENIFFFKPIKTWVQFSFSYPFFVSLFVS